MRPPKVKTLRVADGRRLGVPGNFPNFHRTGSAKGMRRMFYGSKALLVRCGSYIYNVTKRPDIYERAH